MRYIAFILFIIINNYSFSQSINNLKDATIGSNVELSFDIEPKFQNRGTDERYDAEIYVRELIRGYEDESIESYPRRKLNLPKRQIENLRPGRNVILIDVLSYLSEYLGSNTLVEFEVSITPSVVPAYINNIRKLKIGKENSLDINVWENASTSISLAKDGNVVFRWVVDGDNKIDIPKNLKKGSYKLTLAVEAFGNRDEVSKDVQLKKGSPLPFLLILLIGGGVYFGASSGAKKTKSNPPLPSPPLPPGG